MALGVMAFGRWLLRSVGIMFYCVSPYELALEADDKVPNYMLPHGLPMFFIMMAVERVVMVTMARKPPTAAAKRADTPPAPSYRWNDWVASVGSGSVQQTSLVMFELVNLSVALGIYTWVYNNFRIFTIHPSQNPLLTFAFVFLAKDLSYYWFHRYLHEFHTLWVGHAVHHSGEDYNLATALRQGFMQSLWGPLFTAWIALLGVPPPTFAAHSQLNTLYQFFIHTEIVKRLPMPVEYIMNTPSHHRPHHRPPGNCNYAGVLIIWDRMFGTFQPEVVRKDLYGLAKQPNTFDVLKLQVNHFNRMADIGARDPPDSIRRSWLRYRLCARRVRNKWVFDIPSLFKPLPDYKADNLHHGPGRKKWNGHQPMGTLTTIYFVLVALGTLVQVVLIQLVARKLPLAKGLALSVLCLAALSCVGRIADQKPGEYQLAMAAAPAFIAAMTYFSVPELM